jgi:hypothetical protein
MIPGRKNIKAIKCIRNGEEKVYKCEVVLPVRAYRF